LIESLDIVFTECNLNLNHNKMNRKKASIIIGLLIFLTGGTAFAGTPPAPLPGSTPVCDSSLWSHVYHSYRLVINTDCMSVTGIVGDCYSEADGDYHIRLQVDTQYRYLLNSVNVSDEYGDLVCEPICVATITQTDAEAPCQGLTNNVYIPTIGEYVKITGPYVTDNDHGWNELHPVTSIEIVSPAAVGAVKAESIDIKAFPNPANQDVNFALSAYPDAPIQIVLSDALGRSAGQYQLQNSLTLKVNTDWFPAGIYYYTVLQKDKVLKTGAFSVAH
jgi:hypothetical protein